MNIFKTIGDTLTTVASEKDGVKSVNKGDILALIDNNCVVLKAIIEVYDENRDVINYIRNTLIPANGTNKANAELLGMYQGFVKELTPPTRRVESTLLFKSIRDAAVLALDDHHKLRDNFPTLFDQGTDVSSIKLEQLKLSHAAIFGFINLSALMCDWFSYFYTALIGNPSEAIRFPAYRSQMIRSSSQSVARFVSDITNRGARRDIMDVLEGIKTKGDMTLYTSAATLDTYANINDYPGAMNFLGAAVGWMFGGVRRINPVLFIRSLFTSGAHAKYKRNVANRDWLVTKTAILRMDMSGVSPDSPEYQHQLEVLSKYSDIISALDKEIAEYETV